MTSLLGSHVTDREPETSLGQPTENKIFYFISLNLKLVTHQFVSHFDGHFAYLKTLDFYFKQHVYFLTGSLSELESCVKVEVAVPKKPHDFCGRKAALNRIAVY